MAVIASMRMGLSEKGGQFLREQLRSFKYHIVLGGTPSVENFGNTVEQRIHGTGQGTGWSPIIWSMVCDVIIGVMNRVEPGQHFETPDGSADTEQTIDSFVDDANLSVNEGGVRVYNERNGTELDLIGASRQACLRDTYI